MKVVEIELGGESRRLALDLNAVIALQNLTGEDFPAIGARLQEQDASLAERIKLMRLLVWGLLASACPEFEDDPRSLRLVGAWLGFEDLPRVSRAIADLMQDYAQRISSTTMGDGYGPYVPTHPAVVTAMVTAAKIQPGNVVMDLGAGDGRMLFAAVAVHDDVTAIGYELQPERHEQLRVRVAEHKHGSRVTIHKQDFREAAVSTADAILLYLLPQWNAELRDKLRAECKPGCRIVSHDFTLPDWETAEMERVAASDRAHKVYSYIVPERPS